MVNKIAVLRISSFLRLFSTKTLYQTVFPPTPAANPVPLMLLTHNSNNNCREEQIMTFMVVQFSLASFYFGMGLNLFLQHPFLQHPQSIFTRKVYIYSIRKV
jgi:hypothetical protein